MGNSRIYPATAAERFPHPPRSITDAVDREIDIETTGPVDIEDLVDMYVDFDPADRAQGIPPGRESAIRTWLADVLDLGIDVVARHEGAVVGHATLVPENGAMELAIFVHQDYQGAGIGTELLRSLLGAGQVEGIERVWLTVERWNTPAIRLYERVGFEPSEIEAFELEMSLLLADEDY